MAAKKQAPATKAPAKKADWYVAVSRSQTLRFYTAEQLHAFLNPPLREDGTRREVKLLKEFPKSPDGACVFSSYNRKGSPIWPYDAYFILKNGNEVFAPDPQVEKVEVEIKTINVEGYKPKKATTKK